MSLLIFKKKCIGRVQAIFSFFGLISFRLYNLAFKRRSFKTRFVLGHPIPFYLFSFTFARPLILSLGNDILQVSTDNPFLTCRPILFSLNLVHHIKTALLFRSIRGIEITEFAQEHSIFSKTKRKNCETFGELKRPCFSPFSNLQKISIVKQS
ncbi:uncharacterized protein FA14DRAFT_64319 [Meira miltonrushii]|uniref:Uncharacterized protein n=1 Tax=Meira miltonrushii TaxID=1280837 RepID=A0A316VCF1_9BASI|nr:uncharacterized protein FA14DRAFT_64319 [Meira miltonrushii]PWN33661.1 hypothetical protein FA14DRAFT_64319 [Meira miltonrushii]